MFLWAIPMLFHINLSSQTSAEKEVEKVIVESYIQGLINARDFEHAKKGIHEDFMMLGHEDTLLTKKTRDEWIEQRKKHLNLTDAAFTIAYIDIEGDAASSKVRLKRDNLMATDYVFL